MKKPRSDLDLSSADWDAIFAARIVKMLRKMSSWAAERWIASGNALIAVEQEERARAKRKAKRKRAR